MAYALNCADCKAFCRIYDVMAVACGAFLAVAYRAYAIRPYNFRKTNTAKITFDVGKTT